VIHNRSASDSNEDCRFSPASNIFLFLERRKNCFSGKHFFLLLLRRKFLMNRTRKIQNALSAQTSSSESAKNYLIQTRFLNANSSLFLFSDVFEKTRINSRLRIGWHPDGCRRWEKSFGVYGYLSKRLRVWAFWK
jgi:hypothetical protein